MEKGVICTLAHYILLYVIDFNSVIGSRRPIDILSLQLLLLLCCCAFEKISQQEALNLCDTTDQYYCASFRINSEYTGFFDLLRLCCNQLSLCPINNISVAINNVCCNQLSLFFKYIFRLNIFAHTKQNCLDNLYLQ